MAERLASKPLSQNPLPEPIVDQLLDRLASDDVFRSLFEKDPHEALVRLGHQPAPGDTACLRTAKLADKATIAAVRDEMRVLLVHGTLALTVHALARP